MKVIVTGATGLVGRALVRECIANPAIDHAYVVTRRALQDTDAAASPKITVIVHTDFEAWPAALVAQVQDADAVLWALGGRAGQFPDIATATKVQMDYPVACAQALGSSRPSERPPLQFVFCSGAMAEQDPDRTLYFLPDTRHIKGRSEMALLGVEQALGSDRVQVWLLRPSLIIAPDAGFLARALSAVSTGIAADHLAAAMAQIALGWTARSAKDLQGKSASDKGRVLEAAVLLTAFDKPKAAS